MNATPLQRALRSAPERETAGQTRPEQEFFCFRVGDLRLAVPSDNVLEVVRTGPLTPLPRAPSFLMGVAGHRGQVLPVVDLLRFLSKGEARVGPRTRLFIGVSGTFVAAVVSDQTLGLRRFRVADILPPPLGGDAATEHLVGVIPGATPADGFSVLNFARVLQTARQRAVQR